MTQPGSERRLTSVLFADLVSYTTLAEARDTEDVRELLTQYFEVCKSVVRRYGGRVEKFIGDAVMAVWGVPAAHEDDAERAVRAGLELVSEVADLGERLGVPELALRVGVVTGEVSANPAATDQGMVAGDPVNTASRVQAAAPAGEVWVDADTRALTAAAVTYADVGEHTLKGKAEPLRLFRAGSIVAAVGGAQRVDGLEAPLTGRDRELRLVKELFHAAEESRRPRLVVLDGEAGSGKSRLAWEFFKYVDGLSTRVMWHQGRCLSYGEGVAYWALAEAVRGRLGLLEESTDAQSVDALEHTLAQYVPDAEERGWMRPRLASLLGAGGDFTRDDLFAAWARFFERLADDIDAVTLVVDDAQYADGGLLDFLDRLVGTSTAPVFVLLLARPELMAARPDLGGRRTTVVRLEPLTDDHMTALLDGLVDGLTPVARAELVNRAEGVPLYAVETVRALIDRDLVTPVGGRYVLAPSADVDLSTVGAPSSLHALVAARLDALSTDERRVVANASVLGLSFGRTGIGILSADVTDLDGVLTSLQRKEIIATDTDRFSAERGQYRFVQAVVRQVAYATLARRDRKARHVLVAKHLASQTERADDLAVVIAQHLVDAVEAAGPSDPDVQALQTRAAELFTVAADRACALGSYADGLRLYRSAIERVEDGKLRAGVQEQAAEAALALADYAGALDLARAALTTRDAAGDPMAAATAASLVGRALSTLGEDRAAVELLQPRYDELCETPGTDPAQLLLVGPLASALDAESPDSLDTLSLFHVGLRLAEQQQDRRRLSGALNGLAVKEDRLGCRQAAVPLWTALVSLAREWQEWRALAVAESNLADTHVHHDPLKAVEYATAAQADARAHGEYSVADNATANLAIGLWAAGEWGRLSDVLKDFFEADTAHDVDRLRMLTAVDLWLVEAGREPVAGEHDEELKGGRSSDWTRHLGMLRSLRSGDLAAARDAAEGLVGADPAATDDFHVLWPAAVRTALAAGDLALADRLLTPVADAPPGVRNPALEAHLHALRGALGAARGEPAAAVEADLLAAIAGFESYDAPPYRGRAHEDLARWLVAQGRAPEAEAHVAAAREIYQALNASAWLMRLAAVAEEAQVSSR
ncbi:MAG TPA: adenylate/guanylate cyclase domain-containing protein [Nocardioidaceae bacterium]|nr:adenylate/guanylate cyclase domain-containing protein [Nocardioidaceae bacterium]